MTTMDYNSKNKINIHWSILILNMYIIYYILPGYKSKNMHNRQEQLFFTADF